MLTWFDNPPKRGKRKARKGRRKLYGAAAAAHARAQRKKGVKMARRGKRRKLYGAAAKAHARRMARGGGRKRSSRRATARRSSRRRSHAITPLAVASRAGRKLRYRRPNPPFRGIIGQLTGGVQDAAFIVVGKAATNIIAGFIPIGGGMALDLAKKAASALAAGYVGRFISPNASRMMLAGGLAGLVEGFVKQLNIPLISPALAEYDSPYAVGSYPASGSVPGVSAYPQLMAGEAEDDSYLYQ